MICIVNIGSPCQYTLKLKKLDESNTNFEIAEWVLSYIRVVRDLANKYDYEDTTYVFVEVPIHDACLYWTGDSQSLRNTIFHLMFSENMYSSSAVDVGSNDTPIDIIEKMLRFQNSQPSALDLLADVAERSAASVWSSA